MIKALLLIFDPVATWDRIVRARRSLGFILLFYLLPMVGLSCAVEGFGLAQWGKWQGPIVRLKRFSTQEVCVYASLQMVTSLLVVFVGAQLLKSVGESFHGRPTYSQAFTTAAYGLSPVFLLRLLDGVPAISPWITWGIGILLAGGVLYHGVPRVMQPDTAHAFGLYLMSAVLLAMTSGVARFFTSWWVQGKFKSLESILADVLARMPL